MHSYSIKLATGVAKIGLDGLWTYNDVVEASGITELAVRIWIEIDMDTVKINNHKVEYIYCSGIVQFEPETWNIREFGLIYTDRVFNAEINRMLEEAGWDTKFEYSEHGRQGATYVDFDVNRNFAYELGLHAAMGQHDRFLDVVLQ